jgi:hypothetical protein
VATDRGREGGLRPKQKEREIFLFLSFIFLVITFFDKLQTKEDSKYFYKLYINKLRTSWTNMEAQKYIFILKF